MVDGKAIELLYSIKRGIDTLRSEVCCKLREANEDATTGATPYTYTTAASTNATSVTTSSTRFSGVTATNTSGTAFYLKIFNKASAPTVGTDVPVVTYLVPANSTVSFSSNIQFTTGLAFSTTALAPTADTTTVSAGSIITLLA